MDQWILLAPALLVGLAVLLSHVPLGREVLSRGIIFVDLAVAQIAAFGLVLVAVLGVDMHGLLAQAVAFGSALVGALFIAWLERFSAKEQEAMIGLVYVTAATGCSMLLANHAHGGEHMQEMLMGQILWVTWSDVWGIGLIGIGVFVLNGLRPQWLRGRFFYPLFALAITCAVQLVGVYLVFVSLIVPALATQRIKGRAAALVGVGLGALGYALALVASLVWDVPSGPAVVWAMVAVAIGFGSIVSRLLGKPRIEG